MDYLIAICAGIGLAAACGFRVFVPLLIMGLGARFGWLGVGDGFAWVASTPALVALTTAAVAEVVIYYVPWLDHALDGIMSPVAVVAGVLVATAVWPDGTPEYLRWTLGLLAGGSAAATAQTSTVASRWTSTLTTGGLANFIVSTFEAAIAFTLAVLAVVLPILAGIFALLLLLVLARSLLRRRRTAVAPQPIPTA
jgi:hypothetical protein